MRWLIFAFILTACGRPEDPALDIVRLPQTAYGPFDAAAARAVAPDAGIDAGPPHVREPEIGCFTPADPPDDEEEVAPAPFDNCPMRWEGGRFTDKTTSQRRAHNRNICCYTGVKKHPKVIRIPEID